MFKHILAHYRDVQMLQQQVSNPPASREADSELMVDAQALL